MFRLLRGAVQAGIFDASADAIATSGKTTFRNNRLSAVLRADHPNTVRHMAIHQGEEMERAWGQLAWGVKTGGRMFERAHGGQPLFDYLKAKPEVEHIFSRAMAEVNGLSAKVGRDVGVGRARRPSARDSLSRRGRARCPACMGHRGRPGPQP